MKWFQNTIMKGCGERRYLSWTVFMVILTSTLPNKTMKCHYWFKVVQLHKMTPNPNSVHKENITKDEGRHQKVINWRQKVTFTNVRRLTVVMCLVAWNKRIGRKWFVKNLKTVVHSLRHWIMLRKRVGSHLRIWKWLAILKPNYNEFRGKTNGGWHL